MDDRQNLNLSDLNRPLSPVLVVLSPCCILETVENTLACGLKIDPLISNSGVGSGYDIFILFFPNFLFFYLLMWSIKLIDLQILIYPYLCGVNHNWSCCMILLGFPGCSVGKESACNAGNLSSIPGWGRSPGEGNGNPLQYSCLENPMDRRACWATVHGVAKNQTGLNN